ncbi:MAG: exopolyphosphatase [Cryomorphaceae bacterium]|nr:exopolyphosphatase [Cryomorphaceae bacterium]
MNITKLAAIDIGSNSIRLLISNVIEYQNESHIRKSQLVRLPIRLGADSFVAGKISDRNKERLMYAMQSYALIMQVNDVAHMRACATSAMRDAANGDEIRAQIKGQTGIDIEIIDGDEEARLILQNDFLRGLIEDARDFLYVDVGGGSTEITVFKNGVREKAHSFNIGTVRLLNNGVNNVSWDEMKAWVYAESKHLTQPVMVGSGGNINRTLKMSGKPSGSALTLDYLETQYDFLRRFTNEERIVRFDLNVDRADVILHALRIYINNMRWAGTEKIYVPKIGLSDGIVRDLHQRLSQK